MPFCEITQLELPEPFPVSDFQKFVVAAKTLLPAGQPVPPIRREFLGASNLVAWRFRACVESHRAFLDSWRKFGAAIPHEEVYARQQWLFILFVSGVSAIESLCYACYAMCAAIPSLDMSFGEADRKGVSLRNAYKAIKKRSPNLPLALCMEDVFTSEEWELWMSYRNTMTHRSSVLPEIRGAHGAPLPPASILAYGKTWSTTELRGDESAYLELIDWLGRTVSRMLVNATLLARESSEPGASASSAAPSD